jgi:hypothetical protein
MKLNGVSVQGIYVYNEGNTTYEVGDLILYKNGIYIYSKSSEVLSDGLTPDISKDYIPYLGDKLTNLQDWKDFLDGKGEDKYLTTNTLVAILNSYMNDMRLDGIIESAYDYPEGKTRDGWVLDEYKLGSEVGDNTVIDEILRSNSNYAVYRVSRKLQGLWMVDYDTESVVGNYTDEDRKSVLVKQYTYYSSEEDKNLGIETRVQEVIDHIDGTIYYRSAKYDPNLEINGTLGNLSSVSDWHNTRISREYESQVMSIINAYATKIRELECLEKNLKKNFKFKSLDIIPGSNSVLLSQTSTPEAVKIEQGFYNIGPITVVLKQRIQTTDIFYKSYEITIEYSDMYNGSKFLLTDDLYVTISGTKSGDMLIETSDKNVTIQSMYYREFY